MSFTGNENCTIGIDEASEMNSNFRDLYPDQPLGYYFSKSTLESILNQEKCVGIRFYFGASKEGELKITFAGVTADENDILDIIGDTGMKCPPRCSTSNPLNS